MVKHQIQTGLAYLAVLFLVAAISISIAIVAQNEDTQLKREKEHDWLFMGKQYQSAIASYYHQSPDGIKTLPNKIEELLLDKRFIAPVRHLRKAYYDPITSQQNWVLIKNQDDQIIGVYSPSQEPILSTKIITEYLGDLGEQMAAYADIKFVFKQEVTNNQESTDTE